MEKDIDARAAVLGFRNRSEYLRALYEMDQYYDLRPALAPDTHARLLRVFDQVTGKPLVGVNDPEALAKETALPRGKHGKR